MQHLTFCAGFVLLAVHALVGNVSAANATEGKAFEGRIAARRVQGNASLPLLYTASADRARVEVAATNEPQAVNIAQMDTGDVMLIFPHNRSFVRTKRLNATGRVAAAPGTSQGERLALRATGSKTNLFGFACERFEIKQHGETMEIWATKDLFPFHNYLSAQPHAAPPPTIEAQWGGLVAEKKLFPLLAIVKDQNGNERYRFDVESVKQEKISDPQQKLFQPPAGYREIAPLPF